MNRRIIDLLITPCHISPTTWWGKEYCDEHGAVKFLIAELREVRRTRYLTVKILSADFAAASKNSGTNLFCLLKIDITSVIDANENEHTSRWYTVVFCFGDEIYDLLNWYQCKFHYISQILVNNRQKTYTHGICVFLHEMSIFSLSAAFAAVR